MSTFRFKLLTTAGEIEQGIVELPFFDTSAAIRYFERRGAIVLEISSIPEAIAFVMRLLRKRAVRVKRPILAEFFNNLSMLLEAGVPVLSALEELEEDTEHHFLKLTIKLICTDIESGQTFAEAVEKHSQIFSPVLLNMIKVGEETGTLDKMLKKCSEHVQHLHEIIGGTKRALMYPAFLTLTVIGSMVFWFWFVVPRIVGLFKDMGIALPLPTRILLWLSNFFQAHTGQMILVITTLIFTFITLRRVSYNFRYYTDRLLLRIPVLSTIIETSLIARISEFLGILIGAGVGISRTMKLIIDSIKNEVFKERFTRVDETIKTGENLSTALKEARAMHTFALRMISVGEQTGKIEEQTEYVAKVYRDKLNALVEVLGKTLEPAMLVFIGILFAMLIGGLLLPIYDMMTKLS